MTHTVQIKPMSANSMFLGKKIKSPAYRDFEAELLGCLPPPDEMPANIKRMPIRLDLTIGFATSDSGLDNAAKSFIDVLSKKYEFNDKMIFSLSMRKRIAGKGFEFIRFNIQEAEKEDYEDF